MSPVETAISTPIPAGLSAEALVTILHDHDRYIKTTCPQLISYNKVSGSPAVDEACVYEVTDKRPIGQTTYTLTLTNRADGIDTHIYGKAPTGSINIVSKWRVANGKLEESIVIDSNLIMIRMIRSGVEKDHPAQHQRFIEAGCA
jgi:hypothetical protein